MRDLLIGFVVSVLLHGLVLFVCFRSVDERKTTSGPYPIALYPELPARTLPAGDGDGVPGTDGFGQPAGASGASGTPASAGPASSEHGPAGPEFSASTRYVPAPDTSRSLVFSIGRRRPPAFSREALVRRKPRGDEVKERVASWFPSAGSVPGWTAPPDPTQEHLRKARGAAPTVPLSRTAMKPSAPMETKPPRFDFLPNTVQLDALAIVGRMQHPTQLDIYATLSPAFRISADGLDAQLDQLVSKGFLSRKKISPQNLLSVGTLFGGAQIEMSAKNRLNPLYAYTLNVDKTQILRFIDAQIYLLKESLRDSRVDSLAVRAKIRGLETAMLAMIGPME